MSAEEVAALRAEADAYDALAKAKRMHADAIDRRTPTTVDDALLPTVDEVATALGVSRRTVFAWISAGLPSTRRGRFRRVDLAAAREWQAGSR